MERSLEIHPAEDSTSALRLPLKSVHLRERTNRVSPVPGSTLKPENVMTTYHIAQVNIGQIKAPLEDQVMSGFVARLDEFNALADSSPGFVWRLQSPAGNATYLRPYENDRILLNMSVWETIDALKDYVTAPLTRSFCANGTIGLKNSRACTPLCGGFRSDTFRVLTRRRKRLAHLDKHGSTQFAFTFKPIFQPYDEFEESIDRVTS
jgi:hypothetical protein